MKQVLQNEAGVTVVRDVPTPVCPPPNVLVRNAFSVISSGTERSRVQAAQKSLRERVVDQPDLVLKVLDRARREGIRQTHELIKQTLLEETASGYSSAGTVIELGSAVRGLSLGDRVACGGAGYANHAEIITVPRNLCAKVPPGVPLDAVALTTIAAIALHGMRLADVQLGDRVAVIGCGLVGQIACRLATTAGAIVFALDTDRSRVDTAVAAGAHLGFAVDVDTAAAVNAATEGVGADRVLVAAASRVSDPLRLATEIARDRATVVLVGDVPLDVPREVFYEKELAFRVSRSYGPGRYDRDYEERGLDYPIGYVRWTEQRNMESVLDLQARGKLVLRDLIEDVIPINEAERAYARLAGPAVERPRGALAFSYPAMSSQAEDMASPRQERVRADGHRGDGALHVGLIGPGSFAASVLAPALKEAGVVLAAVAGGAGPPAEAMARSVGLQRAAPTIESLLADPHVDAVVITTRHDSHAGLARDALEAGKHVFCEKPLALDEQELGLVLEAAERSGQILMVGFNRRFSPHAQALRGFITSSDAPLAAIYRVSAGKVAPGHWVHDTEQGGGRLIGEVCHFVDTLSFLAESPVARVFVSGFGDATQTVQSRDNLSVTLAFASGAVAVVLYVSSGSPDVPKERLEVFAGSRTGILNDFKTLELYGAPKGTKERLRRQNKGHAEELAQFAAGIRSGVYPIPIETIKNVHQACFAAVASLRTGQAVELAG